MKQDMQLTGVILAGGKSSRMGNEKCMLELDGKPMLEHVLDRLRMCCNEILISTGNKSLNYLGYPLIADEFPERGPIEGIRRSLEAATNPAALVIACDIPFLSHDLIKQMAAEAVTYDMVYLMLPSKQIQPLPVIFSKKVIPAMNNMISKSDYKLQNLIAGIAGTSGLKTFAIGIETEPLNFNKPGDIENYV
jgi:molybdopterin-guanine dinucleotide biosynthesis protein A